MPFAIMLFAIDVVCVIHAAKTGRFSPWAYVILFLPGIGAAAYLVVEIFPAWLGSYGGQRRRRQVMRTIDPDRTYRALSHELEIADTIANRDALAKECLAQRKYDEALTHYDVITAGRLGDEPKYLMGKAQSLMGLEKPAEALRVLDELKARWPDYQSQEGHLTYAKALEAAGREEEALAEYEALSGYYAGAEPRLRRAVLLDRLGRTADAGAAAEEIVRVLRRSPKHVQRFQAEWLKAAEQLLRKQASTSAKS